MQYLIYTLLIGVLLFVFYSDVRYRVIHVVLPISIFVLSFLVNYFSKSLNFYEISYNIGFVLINMLGLILYFSLKDKTFKNPVDTLIGLGDIVFFIAITPLFSLKEYILFFITGLFFSLLIHGVMLLFKKVKTIPLAGYLALFLVVNLMMKNILKINITF